jgi:hypothetical protein
MAQVEKTINKYFKGVVASVRILQPLNLKEDRFLEKTDFNS